MRHGTDSGISFRERKDMREAGGVGANGADLPTWSIDKQFVSPGESFHATWTGDPVWKPLAETIKRAWLISYPARDSSRKLTVQYPHPPQSIKMTVPLSHPPGKFYLSVSWPLYAAQEIGTSLAYDYGYERISWLGNLLTNWVGDHLYLF